MIIVIIMILIIIIKINSIKNKKKIIFFNSNAKLKDVEKVLIKNLHFVIIKI
jgi:hypothetical protein